MFAVKKKKEEKKMLHDFGSVGFNRADSSPEVRAAVNTEGPGISEGKRSDIQEGFGFMGLA